LSGEVVSNAPKFQAAVFFVSDVAASKRFYSEVLGQKIVSDFGANVTFEGGLSIWETNYALRTIFGEKAKGMSVGANNAEIYYETDDLKGLFVRLQAAQVKVIHGIMEHPWGQRGFRVYDPDGHIVEFSEPMSAVVLRLHNQGLSDKDIAAKSMMSPEFIEAVLAHK
jgi:catechol 2,3-dioxygenase-like lactoylglutathione lyase family enzyme